MNYYISDTHFGWTNKYENKTLETDQLIKSNWNSVVTNADDVYMLGDIGKSGTNKDNEKLCELVSTLKGRKHLVVGNHDKGVLKDYRLRQLFDDINFYQEIEDNIKVDGKQTNFTVVLSHYPILIWNGQHKPVKRQEYSKFVHLYGHVHMSEEYDFCKEVYKCLNGFFEAKKECGSADCYQVQAVNVGCMLWDYTPRRLDELLKDKEGKNVE